MSGDYRQNMLDVMPFGVGYLRLLFSHKGQAEDCMLLDVNPAFARLTGWHKWDIVDKRASEIPHFRCFDREHCLAYFDRVLRAGKTQETTQWIDAFKRYLKITAIPVDETSLSLLLWDAAIAAPLPVQKEEGDLLPAYSDVIFNNTHDAISLVEYIDGDFRYDCMK